jgi:hypothetical protein
MESFNDIKKLFQFDLVKLMDDVIRDARVQDEIIEYNHEQLQGGEDALGQTIFTIGGSPYRPFTVKIKRAKGQPTNRVTLYDTGEFYETFSVRILKDGYEITANFKKGSDDIRDNFSSQFDFLGLTDESLAEFVYEVFIPRFTKTLRAKLGL